MTSSIQETLMEAAAWCALALTSREIGRDLRSRELVPGDLMMKGARLGGLTEEQIHAERSRIVNDVVARRRKLLMASSRDLAHERQVDGRVLVFAPDSSFLDGVAAAETNGFFDSEDLPPWDTWTAYCYD